MLRLAGILLALLLAGCVTPPADGEDEGTDPAYETVTWSGVTYTESCLEPTCTATERSSDGHRINGLREHLWINITWEATPGNEVLKAVIWGPENELLDNPQGTSPLRLHYVNPPMYVFVHVEDVPAGPLGMSSEGGPQQFNATAVHD